jgi:hypothetical protein
LGLDCASLAFNHAVVSQSGKSQCEIMKTGIHKIYIAGEWDIRDLYVFPYRYAQLYSFLYALVTAKNPKDNLFVEAAKRPPWEGGFSTINYYGEIYRLIPEEERPQIKRMEYASPGFIELGAVILIVTQIDRILTAAFSSWNKLDAIYDEIEKRKRKRQKEKIEVEAMKRKAEVEDVKFAVKKCKELSDALGLENSELLNNLHSDEIVRLKILLTFYRRLEPLLVFIKERKLTLKGISEEQVKDAKHGGRELELGED